MAFIQGVGPDYPRNCAGYVYVLAARYGGVKVGRSTQPEVRAKTINARKTIEAKIVHVAYFANCDLAEQRAHSRLSKWRLSNEWFSCPVSVAIAAVDGTAEVAG